MWALVGPLGVHRFYCGRIGTGILWFFTGGLAGIGWLVDVFLIPDLVREANQTEPPLFGPPFVGYAQPGQFMPGPAQMAQVPPAVNNPAPVPGGNALPVAAAAPAHRVIYCTQCGAVMQVPAYATGMQYACPSCRTVLEVPA